MKWIVGIWTGNDVHIWTAYRIPQGGIIAGRQTWKIMKIRGITGNLIFKQSHTGAKNPSTFRDLQGKVPSQEVSRIRYFTPTLHPSLATKLGYREIHLVTFMAEIYMTPKSCSQRPQNHATLETQSIFPSRKGHIWKSKTSSIQTISRPSAKKRYTGYTVYNLKPKQFCVQKVSTVSTIGLQPILNPLSPPFLATRYNCPCLGWFKKLPTARRFPCLGAMGVRWC